MSTPEYPVLLLGGHDLERSRLTVFFRLFLLIPHYIVVAGDVAGYGRQRKTGSGITRFRFVTADEPNGIGLCAHALSLGRRSGSMAEIPVT